jgi:hypothetical protein
VQSDGSIVSVVTGNLLQRAMSYSRISSWAVWGSVAPAAPFHRHSNLALPVKDPALPPILRSDVVFLGLNPGNVAHGGVAPWSVFHTGPKHNDHFIAEALRGTPYWGAYMTDLFRQIESKSSLVTNNSADIESLLAQIATVNDGQPVHLIPFGGKTYESLCANETRLTDSGLVSRVTRIPHYSGSNGRVHKGKPEVYRALVHQELAI